MMADNASLQNSCPRCSQVL